MRLTSQGPTRLEELRAVFDEATRLAPDQRAALVRERLADRPDLLTEALAMLPFADDDGMPPARDSTGPTAGERVGRFTLAERCDHAGSSEVWLAWDGSNPVALKLGPDGRGRSRLASEASLLAALGGAGFARLLGHGRAELSGRGRVEFLATEWVDGRRLDRWRAGHAADVRALARMLADVCGVVARAHARGVVHGDLKPANIMVSSDGGVTVLDLGAGGTIGPEGRATGPATPAGTPGYLAPELLRPGARASRRSDVFALGVIGYELLSGRMPWKDDGAGVSARPLSEAAPESRGDLARIVHRAMHPEPRARYADAGALQADLRRFVAGRAIEPPPAPLWSDVVHLVRRHRAASAIAGVLALGVAVFSALLWRESARTLEAQARAIGARDMLLDLAHESLAQSDQLLHAFPGPAHARLQAATRALSTLERVAQDGPADPAMQITLAQARTRLAMTLGLGWGEHLGRRDEALAEINRAIDQLQALPPPLTPRARLALARALLLRWSALPDVDAAGRPVTADLDRSGSLLESSITEDPHDDEARVLLADWLVLAAMHRWRREPDDPASPLGMLDRAAALLEAPGAERIAAPYRAELTARVWRHRAIVHRQAGDLAAARSAARRAWDAIAPLADAERPPAWLNQHAAIVGMELALSSALSDPPEASRLAHAALERIAAARLADPASFPARRSSIVLPLMAAQVLIDAADAGSLPAATRRGMLDSAQRFAADAAREVDALAAEGSLMEWEAHYPAHARAILDRAREASRRLQAP